ncbi:MAG: hypothetical protein AB1610_09280 [Nitrospirota bacterium]
MTKNILIRGGLGAVVLFLVNEVLMTIAEVFYQHPTGRMTSFIQSHNRMVANIAEWVFYFITAGVWVFFYLRDKKAGYRSLIMLMVTMIGFFTIFSMLKNIGGLFVATNSFVEEAANFLYIITAHFVMFVTTIAISGLIALPVIWIIHKVKPLKPEIQKVHHDVKVTEMDTEACDIQPNEDKSGTIHPIVPGVIIGGLSGFLSAVCFISLLSG